MRVVCADALELPAELTGFDRALVDAPCSGLGVPNQRPISAGDPSLWPSCSSACCAPPPSASSRGHNRLLRVHDERRRERGDRRRLAFHG